MRVFITVILGFGILSTFGTASKDKDWEKPEKRFVCIFAHLLATALHILAIIFTWKI